jgi:hypothetical protein
LRRSLAAILIILGFAAIVLYMGSTLFYPMLQFEEFVNQALRTKNIQGQLADRYMHYFPLLMFGSIVAVAGNLIWYSKRRVSKGPMIFTSMIFSITFVVLVLKLMLNVTLSR